MSLTSAGCFTRWTYRPTASCTAWENGKMCISPTLIGLFIHLSEEQNDRAAGKMPRNASVSPDSYLQQQFDNLFSSSAINSLRPLMHGLWGTSLQNARSEAMRQTQQLHFSVTPAQLLGTTPQLPLSIIDETSAVGLICHSAGRSRRWAAAVVVEPADATQGKK